MDSAQETLIAIASASQRVIDALVLRARDRNDRDINLSCKQLEGDLRRIVAASQTLLTKTFEHHSLADFAVDDRLEIWLSSEEPQKCLDTLQEMEASTKSSWSGVTSTLRNIFLSVPVQAIRNFEKNRIYFYFLLNTNVCVYSAGTVKLLSWVRKDIRSTPKSIPDKDSPVGTIIRSNHPSKRKSGLAWIVQTRLKEIMNWLDACDCTEKHEDTLELRQRDTCAWLPDTDEYHTWRYADDAFLWLHGKPGSGKSVLAASVIDDIQNTMGEGEMLAFFYCDFRSGRSTVPAEVIRSLLSQLLQGLGDLGVDPGDVLDVLVKEKRRNTILGKSKRLAVLVSRVAKRYPRPPFVIVDALDECEDIEKILDALLELNERGIRLLVISRSLQVIKYKFSGLSWLSLEQMSAEVYADIRLHVMREVDSYSRLRDAGTMLKEEIIEKLCCKADGMFRWVECQLNILKRCFTTSEIREVLNSLPVGLDETYQRILHAISREERGGVIAHRALIWIVAALQPLRLCQIIEALSIDLDLRTLDSDSAPIHGYALLESMSSLVIHSEEADIVKLAHFSVKEYLVGNSAFESHAYHISLQDAHAQVAQQCMTYITACLTSGLQDFGDHTLLDYALGQGFRHLSHIGEPTDQILDTIVALHGHIQQHSSEWELLRKKVQAYMLPTLQHDFVLYMLICYAPNPLLHLFLCHSPISENEGTNPLIYVIPGKIEHARTLLAHGAKLGFSGQFIHPYDFPSGLPIEVAASSGDSELVDLFLEEGSPVPHRLIAAHFLEGWQDSHDSNTHIFTRLLQTDEFIEWAIDALDKKLLTTALQRLENWLERQNSEEGDVIVVVRRLKQIGCDLSGHTSFVEALIRNAVNTGDIPSIQHLLSELKIQVPPNILLHSGSFWGHRSAAATIRFLLRNGANIHAISADESTALHRAVDFSYNDLKSSLDNTRILCDAGCDPSVCNLQGEMPMHLAVNGGYLSVVKHLLSVGASLPSDILFSGSGSLFHRTISSSIIRFLLREGADARVVAANGDSTLHSALRSTLVDQHITHLEPARMLVEAGCDPYITNSFGQTCLDIAVAQGHISVVKYFLSLNIPLSPDVFLLACRRLPYNTADFTIMVKLLLEHGADPTVNMPDGDNALHLAVTNIGMEDDQYRFEVVKTLVAAGCDPSAYNTSGQTVLHYAAAQGYVKTMEHLLSLGALTIPADILLFVSYTSTTTQIVRLLIEKGANVRAVSADGYTPLHRASSLFPETQIIQLLIDKGGDVLAVAADGNTPLHCAVSSSPESSSLELVKLLIAAGSDPHTFSVAHKTPMHVAAACGYISVINYLLSLGVPLPPDILLAAATVAKWKTVIPIIRFLIDKGAHTTANTAEGDTALHLVLAAPRSESSDLLEAAQILVETGCDINACNSAGETPLHAAVSYGHLNIIKYLLSQGASLPPDILLVVVERGDIDIMEYLLLQGVSVPPSAFIAAASSTRSLDLSRVQTIRFLSTFDGADVRAVAPNGDTALHRAVELGDSGQDCLQTTKLLVHLGCRLSLRNLAGETPLHIAARLRHISVLKYLLSQGAPLPSDVLLSAVSGAYYHPNAGAVIHFLIREGADPCVVNDKGDTPLHVLLRLGHDFYGDATWEWKVVQMLLDAGGNPYARNLEGQTPVDLAEKQGPFFAKNFMRLVRQVKVPILP